MGTQDQIADRDLPPAARAALGRILDQAVATGTEALAAAELPSPACAVCLYHVQVEDDGDFSLPTLALILDADRRRLLAGTSPADAFPRLLNPEQGEGPWVEPPYAVDLEDGRLLAAALQEQDVYDPQRWVLVRVARALTQAGVPRERTGDFVAYVFDQQFGAALVENLRFSMTPAIAAAWEALGLLPRRDPLELGGAEPVELEDIVADVEDEYDDEMRPTGRFNVECHREGAEGGLWHVSLEEALEWSRRHTDLIRLRIGDDEYTAGPEPIPGLPPWPGAS